MSKYTTKQVMVDQPLGRINIADFIHCSVCQKNPSHANPVMDFRGFVQLGKRSVAVRTLICESCFEKARGIPTRTFGTGGGQ